MKKATMKNMELGNLFFGRTPGEYVIERTVYQDIFQKFLEENGFDSYGYLEGSENRVFENEVFVIRPFVWDLDPEAQAEPNFYHKPSGLTFSWYKYPLRNAFANLDITPDELEAVLAQCAESLKN